MSKPNTESFVACVTISRRTSNREDDVVGIEITDEVSRRRVMDLEIDISTFGDLITGRGNKLCKGSLNMGACKLLNCAREHKTVRIEYDGCSGYSEPGKSLTRSRVAEHEVDGWHGRDSDVTNHHNHGDDGRAAVHFERHVRPDGTPVLDD